jgi:hypothetical protein
MDTQSKCCGNCKHFKNENVSGFGLCVVFKCIHHCTGGGRCVAHQFNDNGWTEITPDNVDDIYNLAESRFVDVLDSRTMVVKGVTDWHCTLSTMSKMGGYYYYVLPKLIKEE